MTPISATSAGIAVQSLMPQGGWWYNYGAAPGVRARPFIADTNPGSTISTPGVSFVPMILDPAHNNATELSWVQTYATASGAVLGFNEPYNSAISVADAVSLTGTLNAMFPPSSGVLIVSPSGDVGAASPKAWFDDYFNQCAAAGYRVDIFAFHWSGGWSAGGFNANSSFTNMALNLDAVITRYGLDVWCTEMELYTLDDSGPSLTDYKALWALMIPYLQNYRKVRRYAFWPVGPNPFTGNIAPFSLANFDGSLTAAGSAYSLFGR